MGAGASTRTASQADASPDGKTRRRTVVLNSVSNASEKYNVESKIIGEGNFGTVRRCQNKETEEWFALKTINKAKVSKIQSLVDEVKILLVVNHPNVINVVDVFEDETKLDIVTELCVGGELFDRIIAKFETEGVGFTERDAAHIIQKMLAAIEHFHSQHDIVHRDLKPENVIFKTKDDDSEPVLIDFGLSSMLSKDEESQKMHVGTPYYMAPEVMTSAGSGKPCDIWSVGVIAYIILCGYPPFFGDTDPEIFESIKAGQFEFYSDDWSEVSDEAKAFITRLLKLDPAERPTAAEALEDPWITSKVDALPLGTKFGPRLNNFTSMNALKKAAILSIANDLTETEIGELKLAFEEADKDKSGCLSVEELHVAMADYPDLISLLQEVMRGVDVDNSKSLNYNEFIAATLSRNTFIKKENIKKAFAYFDLDGSKSITVDELMQVFGSREHTLEVMKDIDLNHDGVISEDEFKAMMQDKSTLAVRKGEMGRSKEVTTGSTEIAGAEVQKLVGDGKQNGDAAEAEVE